MADRIIEAGWLLVLVFIPYFFNLLTARHFEPDKATALRAIVLVMLAAWAIKTLERITVGGERLQFGQWWRKPLAIPVVLYATVFLLATVFSIDPSISWWGGYNRLQGTYTNFSYIALFALIVGNLRSREQLDRIVTTVILTGLGVAIYGLIQHAGADPLPWKGDTAQRIASTMGNSIFVAAYLIMVVPFALSRLLAAAARARSASAGSQGANTWLWLAAFVLLLAAQQAFLIGQIKFGAAVRAPDFRYWWVFPGALAVITGSFALTSGAITTRYGRNLPWFVGGSLLLWLLLLLVVYAVSANTRLLDDAATDPNAASWWLWTMCGVVGIGGFSGLLLFGPRRVEGGRLWEWAQVAGYGVVLGVLLLAVLYTQSRGPEIGLIVSMLIFGDLVLLRRWRAAQAAESPRAGRLAQGLALLGVLQAVVILFLVVFNVSHAPIFNQLRTVPYVGRLGELTETGDGTGRVRVLIWKGDGQGTGAIGLITSNPIRTIIGYGPETMFTVYNPFYPPELAKYEARGASPDRSHQAQLDELVTKGALGLLSYFFLFLSSGYLAWRLLWRSTSSPFQLLYLACLAMIVAHLFEGLSGIPIVSTLTMLWVAFAVLIVGGKLEGHLGSEPVPTAAPTEEQPLAIPAGAKVQSAKRGRGGTPVRSGTRSVVAPVRSRGTFRWLYGVLAVVALLGVWFWNLKVVYADMYYNLSQGDAAQGDVGSAVRSFALGLRAVALAPTEDYYYLHLGNALIQLGYNFKLRNAQSDADITPPRANQRLDDLFSNGTSDQAAAKMYTDNSGPQLLEYARIVLEQAQHLSPTNKDHAANLGRLYNLWYQLTPDPTKLQKALEWYGEAARIAPNDVVILDEWATTEMLAGPKSYADAEQKLLHSEQLDPRYIDTPIKLGNVYRLDSKLKEAGAQFATVLARDPNAFYHADAAPERIIASLEHEPTALQAMADALRGQIVKELPVDQRATLPADRQKTLTTTYAQNHAILGLLNAALNDKAGMQQQFEQAITLVPDNIQFRQQYTSALSETAQYDAALKQAQAALQLAQNQKRDDIVTQIKSMITALQQRHVGG